MAPGFTFPENVMDVWAPLPQIEETRDSRYIRVLGRLAPGATLDSSRAEMDAIGARLAATYPATNTGMGVSVITLQEEIVDVAGAAGRHDLPGRGLLRAADRLRQRG